MALMPRLSRLTGSITDTLVGNSVSSPAWAKRFSPGISSIPPPPPNSPFSSPAARPEQAAPMCCRFFENSIKIASCGIFFHRRRFFILWSEPE